MVNTAADSIPAQTSETGAPLTWHIIASEYPPQVGGVSDYTYAVAAGLASRGDQVHVWCPGQAASEPQPGVSVHAELGKFTGADLRRVGRQLDAFPGPRQILVQWVPHGYGYQSMNVGFCWWLRSRAARSADRVEIMVHEAYLPFRADSLRQSVPALVHRLMTVVLLRAAQHVWMSIPEWEKCWRPYALGRRVPFYWLPIPSNIPVADNPLRVRTLRQRHAKDGVLIGHFGTYGWPITSVLEPVLGRLAADPCAQEILLMGQGSMEYRDQLVRKVPALSTLVHATGALDAEDLSCHVAACDLLIQPYPDGVSTRRTSFMVGLSHGKPVVTNTGPLSESFWNKSEALALAPVADAAAFVGLLQQLRDSRVKREHMGAAARQLYQERFDISFTLSALRREGSPQGGL
jgi:glycosyltransferase involved in cell wall biosynthesis